MEHDWDVAVVGCGPVGALAANLFGGRGLKTVVLERDAAPYALPRAVHLDHEMLRLLEAADVLRRVEALLRPADGHIHIGADGGVIRYLGSAGQPKPFSFANDYFFYQPELEAKLREALERFAHVQLRLAVNVTDVKQHAGGVRLSVQQGGRASELQARYVVACDGAGSSVRRALGTRLQDLQFDQPWLVVDAEVEGPIRFPAFSGVPAAADLQRLSVMLCDPRRPATLVPGRGTHRRWEFMLLPGETEEAMVESESVARLLAPWIEGARCRLLRAATYRFHGLLAEQWQIGRVFLAGDAAHQTPPFFGQGMCHGFRDVANLAWKLDLVVTGRADPSLLTTYQVERDPHVRTVIQAAIDAGRYICELDPERARERDGRLRDEGLRKEGMREEGTRAVRARAAPRTAADLIPPLVQGVVAGTGSIDAGVGVRFIQPQVSLQDGQRVRLDQATGGGWVLLMAADAADGALDARLRDLWELIGGRSFVVGRDFFDVDRHLTEWLRRHQAMGVLLRPDFYTYGVVTARCRVAALISSLATDLRLAAGR